MKTIESLDTNCLSNAIEQALDDLMAIESLDNFSINMEKWVSIRNKGITASQIIQGQTSKLECSVCFAGAVMVMRGSNILENTSPEDFEENTRSTLKALDKIRLYCFYSALREFYLWDPEFNQTRRTLCEALNLLKLKKVSYRESPTIFKSNMRKIIHELRLYGC